MPVPAARLAVVLVLGLVVGACGADVDPLVGTWTGGDAYVSVTLAVAGDGTYVLTNINEMFPGMDQRETGTWMHAGEHAFLRAIRFDPLRPSGVPRVANPTVDSCRVRLEQGVAMLETNDLYAFGDGAEAWAHLVRLQRTGD